MNLKLKTIRQPGTARDTAIVFSIIWLVALAAVGFISPLAMALMVPASGLIIWFALKPVFPVYLMAAFYPFVGLEVVVGSFNAPVVDIVAVMALSAWLLRGLWFFIVSRENLKELRFPALTLFIAWVLVSAWSITNSWDYAMSFKYLLRPLSFFYLAYVWVVVNSLKSNLALWRTLFIMYGVGIFVALLGLYGLATAETASLLARRVVPTSLFGINPLGGNQNIIADVMVTTIPIGFFLMLHMKSQVQQKLIFFGLMLMVGVNLLTFSRTGWLTLMLELGILLAFQYRHHLKAILRYTAIVTVIALPLIGYMAFFSVQDPVQSSNENRLVLNDIALEMFSEHPVIGSGPGTFVPTVEKNRIYIDEYGGPLDAHGFVQKIASELGFLGLAAYTALFGYIIIRIFFEYRKHERTDDWSYLLISLFMMSVGMIFFQLFQTSYYVGKLWFPLGMALSAIYLSRENKKFINDRPKAKRSAQ